MENPTSDEKQAALLTHVAALAGMIIPFGNIIGPLIAWLSKRNESEFVDENGKQSMNFQITFTILYFIGFVICFWQMFQFVASLEEMTEAGRVGSFEAEMEAMFTAFILPIMCITLLWLINTIFVIIATIKSQNGEIFNYPLKIRFIK